MLAGGHTGDNSGLAAATLNAVISYRRYYVFTEMHPDTGNEHEFNQFSPHSQKLLHGIQPHSTYPPLDRGIFI